MDTWQAWIGYALGLVATLYASKVAFDRSRKQKEFDSLSDKLEKHSEKLNLHSERLIKLESEFVSDKDVREILKEFFLPFMETLGNIEKDISQIKIDLAERKGRDEAGHR